MPNNEEISFEDQSTFCKNHLSLEFKKTMNKADREKHVDCFKFQEDGEKIRSTNPLRKKRIVLLILTLFENIKLIIMCSFTEDTRRCMFLESP